MYIGVDLGGTGIKVGLVDDKGEILLKDNTPTRADMGYEVISKDIADLILSVINKSEFELSDFKSIGIGCPGSIDDKNGVVYYSNNIAMKDAPMANEVQKYINLPIYMGNDANCAALGEFFALDDPDIDSLVAITLGTGVGGGIIIDRKIFTGFNGIAAELGHMMIDIAGEYCSCGRRGCWEAYASATALIRDTERAAKENSDSVVAKLVKDNGNKGSGKTAFKAAREGDETGQKLVDNYVKYVSEGIINIINIFQPHVVVVGGGVSKEGEDLIDPIIKYVSGNTFGASDNVPATEISLARLGNDAGIIGAAFLGR